MPAEQWNDAQKAAAAKFFRLVDADLRPVPHGVGKRTLDGTRAAARTTIRYRNGVLNGKGASLLDGYMEEPSVNGDPKGVWPYHYECWYTLLKDRGAKWIEPFAADSDTVPAAHM